MLNLTAGGIYSLDDVRADCLKIAEHIKSSNYCPDLIIGVSDGGIAPARFVGEFLSVPVEILNISRPSFVGLFRKVENFNRFLATIMYETMFMLSSPKIREEIEIPLFKNILLVDDMAHTGKTIKVSTKYLNKSLPKSIKTAVISNKSNLDIDYSVNSLKIIFPWSKNSPYYNFYAKSKR